jgi:N-acetylneuraminate synthase
MTVNPSNTNDILLNGRKIGPGEPTFIVMEVAQAHDGSLGQAHAFIDLAANKGADAVKFQTHIADAESTAREAFRVQFSYQDTARYDYWKRMEFTPEQWAGLRDHAVDAGLTFLSSPFSVEAIEFLNKLGVQAWKLGAGEILNSLLLDAVLRTRKPILLSTGMATWNEIDAIVDAVRVAGVSFLVYQCTSRYPTIPEEVGLNLLSVIQNRYSCVVGLSDHSGEPCFGIAAVALGASSVEVHMTMSEYCFGPDVPASLTPTKLGILVDGIRKVEKAMQMQPSSKDEFANSNESLRVLFGRSIVAKTNLPAGTVLTSQSLAAKKPGGGLPASMLNELIGRRLHRAVVKDFPLTIEDLEL